MFSKINNITCLKNESLKKHCSFKVGGNAKFFVSAHNIDALIDALYTCKQHAVPHKIVGNGSNMLYDDHFMQVKNDKLYASSGTNLNDLISYAQQYNLGGLEFTIGVPAQLGGAIVNNLGAYNHEISTYIEHITILRNKHIIYLSKDDCNFNYHSSIFQDSKDLVLSAIFNLPHQDKSITHTKILEYFTKRKNSQPLDKPNAGSVFKRIDTIIPAKLIDEAGLKGLTIGNAQISTQHSGFIVNLGNAKRKDILKIIEIIKNKIHEKYGTFLIMEIEYLPYK